MASYFLFSCLVNYFSRMYYCWNRNGHGGSFYDSEWPSLPLWSSPPLWSSTLHHTTYTSFALLPAKRSQVPFWIISPTYITDPKEQTRKVRKWILKCLKKCDQAPILGLSEMLLIQLPTHQVTFESKYLKTIFQTYYWWCIKWQTQHKKILPQIYRTLLR